MRILSREDLTNILYGCAILGTGGGGTLEEGFALIDEAFALGGEFKLASFDELEDDDLIGTPYGCGAISPLTEEEIKKYARLPEAKENPYTLCMKQLETYMGKELKAVTSTELGGMNTATAFYCAAVSGKLIMDSDPAGRSVPCLQHSTYYLQNVPMCPMSVMNKFGEGAVFSNVYDDMRGEDMVRALACVSQNMISVCDHVNTAKVLKNALILGAISYAEQIGKAFLENKAAGKDYVSAVVEAGKGKAMFQGEIESNEWDTVDGYTVGTTVIKGTGAYTGHELQIWYQNENIMSWLDGDYYCMAPDLICVFNEDEKMPQMNPYGKKGTNVSVIALPSPKEWTTPKGLEVFGPHFFGFDVDYRPFCE
ncbi:MAG: DUF917 domain-containing protein [Lachnospiraceae bacterium]|nr:DUF917 domain-containing protein [Lachnospiraceae bacterium]